LGHGARGYASEASQTFAQPKDNTTYRIVELLHDLAQANNRIAQAQVEVANAKQQVVDIVLEKSAKVENAKEQVVDIVLENSKQVNIAKEQVVDLMSEKSALILRVAHLDYALKASKIQLLTVTGTLHMRGMCGELSPLLG
jgi:hypothetical protein